MAMYNGIEVSEEYGGDMRMIDDPDNPTIEGIWDSERLRVIYPKTPRGVQTQTWRQANDT